MADMEANSICSPTGLGRPSENEHQRHVLLELQECHDDEMCSRVLYRFLSIVLTFKAAQVDFLEKTSPKV